MFPGAFPYNTMKSYEKDDINGNSSNINNKGEDNNISENYKKDFKCNNYLYRSNNNSFKNEEKNGLSLAFNYYSSILEKKILE